MGHYTRGNAELCLLAVKGKLNILDHAIYQIIESKIQKHSQKPQEVREKIVKLLGALPRIELFAREKIEGWDSWGNEIKNDIEMIK